MQVRQVGADAGFVPPPRRQVAPAMVCLVASLFLASVSQTILAAVMPLIVADLGGFDRYAWAAAAYLVTATVTYPIVGRLSDAYRRKRFLVAGLVTFVAGTMLVGMSQSMNQIIAFRAFQGIGGGMVTTCCYVAITDLFPPEERGKFHGMIGAVHGLSSVAGPILGGIAAERLSWEWRFFLVAMAGVPITWLAARTYPAPVRHGDPGPIDVAGMLMLGPAVVFLTLALSAGGGDVVGGPSLRIGLLAFGTVMAAVFVFVEIRSESPIMPLEILADRMVAVCVVVSLLTSFACTAPSSTCLRSPRLSWAGRWPAALRCCCRCCWARSWEEFSPASCCRGPVHGIGFWPWGAAASCWQGPC